MKTTPWLAGWQARADESFSDGPPALFRRHWGCRGRGEAKYGCLRLPSDPGAPSLARPGFALYVTREGGGPMSVRTLLASGDMDRG